MSVNTHFGIPFDASCSKTFNCTPFLLSGKALIRAATLLLGGNHSCGNGIFIAKVDITYYFPGHPLLNPTWLEVKAVPYNCDENN